MNWKLIAVLAVITLIIVMLVNYSTKMVLLDPAGNPTGTVKKTFGFGSKFPTPKK